ncbi:MAG: 50S ribosomal protein L35 [Nitrospira sp.]|nr:50S ribosomal protein L35 [Candidatus Manganitrophaceae bacterium]HIL35825.1 50S ribosomal protein L35 [Candidatus Manganitrophaceae bacterium]
MKNKIKTHRGAAKRFKISGTGKVMRKQAGTQHLLVHKSGKRRRNLRGAVLVSKGEAKTIKRLLPNG